MSATAPRSPARRVLRRTARAWVAAIVATALILMGAIATPPAHAVETVSSGDASVRFDPASRTWTLETSAVRRDIRFANGTLTQTALINKATGRDYQQSGASSEFRIRVGTPGTTGGTDYRGSTGGWTYDGHTTTVQPNGSLELSVTLSTPYLRIVRHYWLHPQTSFIEERTDITNRTASMKSVTDYSALSMRVLGDEAADVDMYSMSGDKASGTYQQLKGPVPMASGLQNPGGRGGNGNQQFVTLHHRDADEGIVATWDYTGNWVLNVGDYYGKILIEPRATLPTNLTAGQTIMGPLGRIGLYQGDLDDMGNTLLDFTYRYLWDHTDDEYFPLIRYGGYGSDPATVAAKIRQLSYIGGDMVWIDDGWQDKLGDWNAKPGEPLAEYRDFAALHDQKVGYWLVPWGAEAGSDVASAHPDWMVNPADRKGGLDTTKPGVVDHIAAMLADRQASYGPFMLKTDFGADYGNLAKANATQKILADFVTDNPAASLQLCSDGGGLMNMGTVALSDLALQRDGTAGREDGYWTSMLYPTEKLIVSYGRGDVGAYSPSNRHLLSFHLTIAGDTDAGPAALEPLRVDAELYRYLKTQGVIGRWVDVYRPTTTSGDATGIIQKMSGDTTRGYITFPKSAFTIGSSVTIFPKGLTPFASYTVATQEGSAATQTKTGEQWMGGGITMASYVEGEIVYFNLQNRPGSGTDTVAPIAPGSPTAHSATHLGQAGRELTWAAASDNRWLSYYEVQKNGQPYSKVSKGEYFFDAGATSADMYRLRTVDGDGNTSAWVTVPNG